MFHINPGDYVICELHLGKLRHVQWQLPHSVLGPAMAQ
ncbi:hypothetical protein FHX46_000948 [Amycolatopsis viridis]|uniref:Uncharacterized protein n=1 Tax=Amycolatopsis viridis TaxID=185678 RepID=A0ABX0SPE0_9PSEU|nr:hypothetical protein [Amycolatopsis viridis]